MVVTTNTRHLPRRQETQETSEQKKLEVWRVVVGAWWRAGALVAVMDISLGRWLVVVLCGGGFGGKIGGDTGKEYSQGLVIRWRCWDGRY